MIDRSQYAWAIARLERAFTPANVMVQERDCGFGFAVAVKFLTRDGVLKRCGLVLIQRHCLHSPELDCAEHFHKVEDLNDHPEQLDSFIASCDQEFVHA